MRWAPTACKQSCVYWCPLHFQGSSRRFCLVLAIGIWYTTFFAWALRVRPLALIADAAFPSSSRDIVRRTAPLARHQSYTSAHATPLPHRIAIPYFTQGLGAFFQPVHTMTGIIAQEMGEVVRGSIHYRALFMVGLVLFAITLAINYVAQKLVMRYRMSIG